MKYAIKEGFTGFKRAPISMLITVFIMTLSLIILGIFWLTYSNANSLMQSLRNRVEFEVFLSDSIDVNQTNAIKNLIISIEGIKNADYVSKDEAAEIFKKEFGEDVKLVLDFNPLPASFKIFLDDKYKNTQSTQIIESQLSLVSGIEKVKYRKTLLRLLDERSETFLKVSFGIGILLLLASFFLATNTIRLIIYAKRKIISTMKLLGATRGFIRTPFILQGIIQGLIAGMFATLVLFFSIFALTNLIGPDLAIFIKIENYFYFAIIVTGCSLGFFASLYSIRKFLKEDIAI